MRFCLVFGTSVFLRRLIEIYRKWMCFFVWLCLLCYNFGKVLKFVNEVVLFNTIWGKISSPLWSVWLGEAPRMVINYRWIKFLYSWSYRVILSMWVILTDLAICPSLIRTSSKMVMFVLCSVGISSTWFWWLRCNLCFLAVSMALRCFLTMGYWFEMKNSIIYSMDQKVNILARSPLLSCLRWSLFPSSKDQSYL